MTTKELLELEDGTPIVIENKYIPKRVTAFSKNSLLTQSNNTKYMIDMIAFSLKDIRLATENDIIVMKLEINIIVIKVGLMGICFFEQKRL